MPALDNLVREISTGTGAGNLTLTRDGGYRRLSEAYGIGDGGADNPYIFIVNIEAASEEWEIRKTYMSSADTLVRSGSPYLSSSSNATVNFSAGTKSVTSAVPAAFLVQLINDRELFDGVSFMALARALGVAQLAGDRFADSFGALDYVDTGGATNLDSGESGKLKPSKSVSTATIHSNNSTGSFSNTTVVDRNAAIPNNRVVHSIGFYSTVANANYAVLIVKRNSAGNYDAFFSQTVSHNGAGWNDFVLSSDQTIPASGDYYIAIYCPHASTVPNTVNATRSIHTGLAAGSGVSFTEDTAPAIPSRYGYDPTTSNMTVSSTGVAPVKTPTKMILLARIKHNETAVAGVDYNFQVSRNGGSDYTGNLTLNDRFTDPGDSCHVIESDPIDVSAQTSPSSVKWKLTTANNKDVELHDVYFKGG